MMNAFLLAALCGIVLLAKTPAPKAVYVYARDKRRDRRPR
jgi:hypothetical protein